MEATVSEQNPVATMLQYYKTANMSRMEPQLLGFYAGKKREEPLAHMHVAKKTSATLTEGDCTLTVTLTLAESTDSVAEIGGVSEYNQLSVVTGCGATSKFQTGDWLLTTAEVPASLNVIQVCILECLQTRDSRAS